MTKIQIEEFQKLEMSYLDVVRDEDPDMQMKMMELIFFWLRKQMRAAVWDIKMWDPTKFQSSLPVVSEMQKQEFTFLQMAMIKAVGNGDREKMIEVELKMREWITIQIAAEVSKVFKPEMRIIRKN